jgi:hypothetical protein
LLVHVRKETADLVILSLEKVLGKAAVSETHRAEVKKVCDDAHF